VAYPIDKKYYTSRRPELMAQLEADIKIWSPFVFSRCGEIQGYKILLATRRRFKDLVPLIPYIGGEKNRFTKNLVESVRYLALFQAMAEHGQTAEAAGRIIYDAFLVKAKGPRPLIPPAERLTTAQLMERNKRDAELSQERHYPGDYVYSFILGTGKRFDYGFDFTGCASQKFYHTQGADEFLPFYCYLDFAAGQVRGFGFTRTLTLYEGRGKCNHRFKTGGVTKAGWPPPFVKRGRTK